MENAQLNLKTEHKEIEKCECNKDCKCDKGKCNCSKKIPPIIPMWEKVIIIILLIILMLVLTYWGYWLSKHKASLSQTPTITPTVTTSTTTCSPEVKGSLKEISDLDLIDFSYITDGNIPKVHYYDAGTYTTGTYKDYTRVIAITGYQYVGVSGTGTSVYIFATKDHKSFILDQYPDSSYYSDNDTKYLTQNIKMSKVTSVANISSDFKDSIELDSKLGLYKDSIIANAVQTNQNDSNGEALVDSTLPTDFSNYISLPSNNCLYKYYYSKLGKDYTDARKDYLNSDTNIIVVDSTGIGYSYTLTSNATIAKYKTDLSNYLTAETKWQEDYKNNPDLAPSAPTRPNSPSLLIPDTSTINSNQPIYSTYHVPFPNVCGIGDSDFTLKNLTDSDFTKIGTNSFDGIDYYVLKNKSNDLYSIEYDRKVGSENEDNFKEINDNIDKPSKDQYIAKNPLIFFKDSFNRWVVQGEYYYKIMGGCGKPVMYLYPTKPTEVKISFADKIQLNTNIPLYKKNIGWDVMATPSGKIKDLNQKANFNCNIYNISSFGSEYAKDACLNNSYPYIYWSGNNFSKDYPEMTTGFVVSSSNLKSFMNSKLNEIGLNSTEKSDMISYWIPEMLSKNAPYFRVSFIQTYDMNKFIPLNISPRPESINRIFLDYEPLNDNTLKIQPESLHKFVRKGFTLVEWGGIKR